MVTAIGELITQLLKGIFNKKLGVSNIGGQLNSNCSPEMTILLSDDLVIKYEITCIVK